MNRQTGTSAPRNAPTLQRGGLARPTAALALTLAGAFATLPVAADDEERPRPRRLTDALAGSAEWDIAIPEQRRTDDFRSAVLSGTALESATYVELHAELLRVVDQVESGRGGEAASERLSELRQRLRRRVELNMDAGYFYAAGVYIELLDYSGAPSGEVRRLTETLGARRG